MIFDQTIDSKSQAVLQNKKPNNSIDKLDVTERSLAAPDKLKMEFHPLYCWLRNRERLTSPKMEQIPSKILNNVI